MNFKKQIFIFSALIVAVAAQAQRKGETALNLRYEVGVPMGSLKTATPATSYRGFGGSILYGLNNKLAIGVATGYQGFYQKYQRQQYQLSDGSDMSAVRSFSIQTIPVLATVKYSFVPSGAIRPFAAVGVGGNLINYNDYAGEFSLEQKSKLGFAARPEAGVFIPLGKTGETGITLGASYNIMPFKSSAVTDLNHVGVQAGLTLPLRK